MTVPTSRTRDYADGVEKLGKATGGWVTVSSTSFVGLTFVIDPAEGELFRITTNITERCA